MKNNENQKIMKKVKLFSLVLLMFISFNTYSQSSYCKGWEKGYEDGYCYKKVGCVSPVPPVCPVRDIGESTHKDGYLRGFKKGMSDNNGKSNKGRLQPNRSNGIGNKVQEYIRYNRENNYPRKSRNKIKYEKAMKVAYKAMDNGNYHKCVRYYEESKNLGYSDNSFEYMTSSCYYALWIKNKNDDYFKKFSNLLILSAKHGNQSALKQMEKFNKMLNE